MFTVLKPWMLLKWLIFGICLTNQFFLLLLHDRPGLPKTSRGEPLEISEAQLYKMKYFEKKLLYIWNNCCTLLKKTCLPKVVQQQLGCCTVNSWQVRWENLQTSRVKVPQNDVYKILLELNFHQWQLIKNTGRIFLLST